MTFTELMSLLAFTTPLMASLESGWEAGRGFGILAGLIVGLILSLGSFRGMRAYFRWDRHHQQVSPPHRGVVWIGLSWLLCFAMVIWIFAFVFFGMWLTKFIIHYVAA